MLLQAQKDIDCPRNKLKLDIGKKILFAVPVKPWKSFPARLMGKNGKHITANGSQPPKGWSHLVCLNYLWQQRAGVSGLGICLQSCFPHIPNYRHGVLAHLLLESACSFSNLFQVQKEARGAILLALIIPDIDGTLLLFSLNVCAVTCPSSGHPATGQSCNSSCITKTRQRSERDETYPRHALPNTYIWYS